MISRIKSHKFKIINLILSVFLLTFFLIPQRVRGIMISPLRETVVIAPGNFRVVKIKVRNDEQIKKLLVPEVDSFSIDPNNGRAVFGQADGAEKWVAAKPTTVILDPGKEQDIEFTITVPESAEPRSRYLGLFIKENPTEGQVEVGSRVGSLLFLHIAGEAREELSVTRFGLQLGKIFSWSIRNNGTIHAIPEGEFVARNLWGREIVRGQFNPNNWKLLPNETWDRNHDMTDQLRWYDVGLIRTELAVKYGLQKKMLTIRTEQWYLPLTHIVVVIVLLIAGLGYFAWRQQRR